jgi:DNA-binding CsgD family transcriptional regulator/methylmalonyl-CoA mutase cobalamin-binding subunit
MGKGGSGPDAVELFADRYLEALRAPSLPTALEAVDEALAGSVPASDVHGAVRRALLEIGELWSSGKLGVGEEHVATEITLRALQRLREPLRIATPGSREKILLAVPAGERHDIGLRIVADVLEGAGFDVIFTGPDLPVGALVALVEQHQPAVLGLTCTRSRQALVDTIRAISTPRTATRILLGGPGVPAWLRNSIAPWVDDSTNVVATVEGLLDAPVDTCVDSVSLRPGQVASDLLAPILTPRQTEVLVGLAEGKSTEQIASELVLTPVTIRNHVANILAALGVHSRLEAVVTARRRGLID